MEKGQISFDLLLTAVVLLVFFGTLTTLTGFLESEERISSVRAQERQILSGIVDIATNAAVLSGGGAGSRATFLVPKIFVPRKKEKQSCTISFDVSQGRARIEAIVDGASIVEERNLFFHPRLSYTATKCGENMVIERGR